MGPEPASGGPPPTSLPSEIFGEIAAQLERARREALAPVLGPGAATNRVAHLLTRAALLRDLSELCRRQAVRCSVPGERRWSDELMLRAERLGDESEFHERQAVRIEAQALCPDQAARYIELQRGIDACRQADALSALANELLQARVKLGDPALRRLAGWMHELGGRHGLTARGDLSRRIELVLETEPGAETDQTSVLPRLRFLAREAERLAREAEELSRRDLKLRIELLGAELKLWQRDSPQAGRGEGLRLVRGAFGTLTRISRERRPGWTPVLDSKVTDEDWAGRLERARQRAASQSEKRNLELSRARRQQRIDAIQQMRERNRSEEFIETVERLRALTFRLGRLAPGPDPAARVERDELEHQARLLAVCSVRLASDDEELARIGPALGGMVELIGRGRALRPLRRALGLAEPGAGEGEEEEAVLDSEAEAQIEAAEAYTAKWPDRVVEMEGAGTGERVLLVGGLPSERRKEELREFFGWSEAEWAESYREKQASFRSLRQRIAADRFDRVIVLARFCGHDVSASLASACRMSGVAYTVHPRSPTVPALATEVYGG